MASTQSFQLLLADDPTQFLQQASDLDGIARRQSDILHKVTVASQQLAADKLVAKQQSAALDEIRASMAAKKQAVDSKVAEAERLLSSLKAEERRKLEARQAAARAAAAAEANRTSTANRPSRDDRGAAAAAGGYGSGTAPSDRAAGAVRFALAQVGKRYVYAGTGPSSYDCSGLTMAAYRSVGVYLPHQSGAQFGSGRRVSTSELRPGRPGLLLLTDPPRRHLHRRRPDRARRQPLVRRPDRLALLHAVLRRRPSLTCE